MSSKGCCCSTPCSRGGWANGRCSAAACPRLACRKGPYPAVSAETPGAGIENLPGAGQFLRRRGVPSAWRLRANEQVGVVAVSRDRNALVIRDLLAEVATGRVGISPEYDDALDTSRALGIAAVAKKAPATRQHRRFQHRRQLGCGPRSGCTGDLGQGGAPTARPGRRSRPCRAGHPADHAPGLARVRRERLRRRTAALLPPQHRGQPAAPPRSAQRPVTQRSPRRSRPVHCCPGSQAPLNRI